MLRSVASYPMSEQDRRIQDTARRFVDEELIPHEVEAEMAGGRTSDELRERHHRMAIELGLYAMNMPKELGGGGMTTFQQVLVSEQIGRVTNGLGWCVHTPPAWAPAVVS
jgi:acyl-CoA dehydrogenase